MQKARPSFHFTARIGWLNDPNGFSFHEGKWHLFYQYHPYSVYWGPMHWGHAVSTDLITWEYLPAALAPDSAYDRSGCFSGSALSMPDGRHLLMYTGCCEDGLDPLGKGRFRQCQCIAERIGNGEYIKYEGNPVITQMPEGGDPYEFRDPYLWRAGDGTYRALVACGRQEKGGTQLSLYGSQDGRHWNFRKVLFEDSGGTGGMWECPSFFPIGGRHLLIACVMDMAEEQTEGSVRFPQGSNACWISGDYDEQTERFFPDQSGGAYRVEPVDHGLDLYAPQVTRAVDGRQILIGWMQDPKTAGFVKKGEKRAGTEYAREIEVQKGYCHADPSAQFFGQMTIPRELKWENGKLIQWPVREFQAYRKSRQEYQGILLQDEELLLNGVSGRVIEMDLEIAPDETAASLYKEFTLQFAKDETHGIKLSYRPAESMICIDRSRSGQCKEIPAKRTVKAKAEGGKLGLKVLLDKWSAEIFVNGGEQVLSLTYYTPVKADGITFSAKGSVKMNVTAYQLQADEAGAFI